MELYYKDLISEEASLEKLVDDLMLVVQGANDLAEAAGTSLPADHREEITTRLKRLKEGCLSLKRHAVSTALATDKLMRQYPWSSTGLAFGIGVLAGLCCHRMTSRAGDQSLEKSL